jgi:tRNA:m4X modification enzyme
MSSDSEARKQKAAARASRKQRKQLEAEEGAWSACTFFLQRKQRFCNVQRLDSSLFCCFHTQEGSDDRKRAVCPLDPTHVVLEENLEAHVAKCRRIAQQALEKRGPFFNENCNRGSCETACEAREVAGIREILMDAGDALHAGYIMRLLRFPSPPVDLRALSERLLTWHRSQELCEDAPALAVTEALPLLRDALSFTFPFLELNAGNELELAASALHTSHASSRFRHEVQQVSIVSHALLALHGCGLDAGAAQKERVFECVQEMPSLTPLPQVPDSLQFIEFGAGKAKLSRTLGTLVRSNVLLVERAPVKGKADKDLDSLVRVRLDIADFDLEKFVACQKPSAVVALGKHLCGGATDLALRCLARVCRSSSLAAPPALDCIAIATCCHHACIWEDFVGKQWWLNTLGCSAADFEVARYLSSWAVLMGRGAEQRPSTQVRESEWDSPPCTHEVREWDSRLSFQQRVDIGRAAKAAIDAGRCCFISEAFPSLSPRVKPFAPIAYFQENKLLLASRKGSL